PSTPETRWPGSTGPAIGGSPAWPASFWPASSGPTTTTISGNGRRWPGAMEISVIIPTCNNRDVLARTLHTLQTQQFPHDQYEIVVVDDGSTDGTAEMIRAARGRAPVRYHAQAHRGRAAARNAGVRIARGRIVVFLDSDFWADPTLLAAHHAHYPRDARAIVVQGASRTHPESLTTPFMKATRGGSGWRPGRRWTHPESLTTPFMKAREVRVELPPGPPGRIS